MMRSLISLGLLLFAALVSAVSTSGNRLLVVLDTPEEKDAYSTVLKDLKERGFEITYESPKSESLSLFHLGERTYDHVMILPTKMKALGPNLTPNKLIDFMNAEGNILVTMSSTHTVPSSLVSLLAELDISLPADRTATVVDHFNYDTVSAAESHDVLVLEAPMNVRPALKPYFEIPGALLVAPHAVGHTLGSGALLTPVLRAPATAYSYNPKDQGETIDPDELFAAGQQLSLFSVFQARNSARLTVLGSAGMLQNQWISAKVSKVNSADDKPLFTANREYVTSLMAWTFKEIGVLRVNSIEHHMVGSDEKNPEIYRIKNEVEYSISISEFVWQGWAPYKLPAGDSLQLEFSMLSPFHRLDLKPSVVGRATVFTTNFTLPDQHGIFNFKVNYKRPFLTNVEEKNTVSVRHMAHDEWPRSYVISGAWPWMAGIAVTIIGFIGFSALWMYSAPVKEVAAEKKKA